MRLRSTTISRRWVSGDNNVEASFLLFGLFTNFEFSNTLLLQAIVDLADMMKFSMFRTGTHLIHIPF